MKDLTTWSKEIYEANKAKGFWDKNRSTAESIALMHSELSEALEADRKGRYCDGSKVDWWNLNVLNDNTNKAFKMSFNEEIKDTLEDELADTVIRVLDFCGRNNIDIQKHIEAKLRYNSLRPHKHGKNY